MNLGCGHPVMLCLACKAEISVEMGFFDLIFAGVKVISRSVCDFDVRLILQVLSAPVS